MALILMLVTHPDEECAVRLSDGALEAGLAACILRAPVNSMYDWKGERCDENEVLTLFKTTPDKADLLEAWLIEAHPYVTPVIMRLGTRANEGYETWVRDSLGEGEIYGRAASNANFTEGNPVSSVFGGQGVVPGIEESDISDDDAIAQIRDLMEGMDELEELVDD